MMMVMVMDMDMDMDVASIYVARQLSVAADFIIRNCVPV